MCSLRGLWIFKADSELRLVLSKRFPTVEKRTACLHGEDYSPVPTDREMHSLFFSDVLHEREEREVPPSVPPLFREEFSGAAFAWDEYAEACAERPWPSGPVCALRRGRQILWPVVFIYRRGFYLTALVGLQRRHCPMKVRAIDFPEITAAFQVLEDLCEFVDPNVDIRDKLAVADLQFYIRCALPFGSPVVTSLSLLKQTQSGFPSSVSPLSHRLPAWKPFLVTKGSSKLQLSIVETVNCTIYGKQNFVDDCFLAGVIYCRADLPGVPEVTVPLKFHSPEDIPEIAVHPCCQLAVRPVAPTGDSPGAIVGTTGATRGRRESGQGPGGGDSTPRERGHAGAGEREAEASEGGGGGVVVSIGSVPPTGPFLLCRYRYSKARLLPVRGCYQVKELSPSEIRILLQIRFHPEVAFSFGLCTVRIPMSHRGCIKSHDLKCSGGTFSVSRDARGDSILWSIQVRRGFGQSVRRYASVESEANLLGEISFDIDSHTNANGSGSIQTGGGSGGPQTSQVGRRIHHQHQSFSGPLKGGTHPLPPPKRPPPTDLQGATKEEGDEGERERETGGHGGHFHSLTPPPLPDRSDRVVGGQVPSGPLWQVPDQTKNAQARRDGGREREGASKGLAQGGGGGGEDPSGPELPLPGVFGQGAALSLPPRTTGADPVLARGVSLGTAPPAAAEWGAGRDGSDGSPDVVQVVRTTGGGAYGSAGSSAAASPHQMALEGSAAGSRLAGAGPQRGFYDGSDGVKRGGGRGLRPFGVGSAFSPSGYENASCREMEREREREESLARDKDKEGSGNAAVRLAGSAFTRDPFVYGVNCFAEVEMEIPDKTISGLEIDPKAVSVYPAMKLPGGVSCRCESVFGKYIIWNMHGEVRASHCNLDSDSEGEDRR